ncbi:MAG: hypothetical protein LBE12_10135 [Planctomycetaceae bacterium]|nr:hypothetical protein [Planctomycetaceae bacterium]
MVKNFRMISVFCGFIAQVNYHEVSDISPKHCVGNSRLDLVDGRKLGKPDRVY